MYDNWNAPNNDIGITSVYIRSDIEMIHLTCIFYANLRVILSGISFSTPKKNRLMMMIISNDTTTATIFLQKFTPFSQQIILGAPLESSTFVLTCLTYSLISTSMTVVISKNLHAERASINYLNTTGIYIFRYLCTYTICYSQNNILINAV